MKLQHLLNRIRPWFRWRKKQDPISVLIEAIRYTDRLQTEDKMLIVNDKREDGTRYCGVVFSHQLSQYYIMAYVQRMSYYTKRYGSLDRFLNARYHIPGFAKKHDPDRDLLDMCRMVRLAINFNLASQDQPLLPDTAPLFITMMDEDYKHPTHVGYEADGVVELKQHETKEEPK